MLHKGPTSAQRANEIAQLVIDEGKNFKFAEIDAAEAFRGENNSANNQICIFSSNYLAIF